jgi:hypothetical protein
LTCDGAIFERPQSSKVALDLIFHDRSVMARSTDGKNILRACGHIACDAAKMQQAP